MPGFDVEYQSAIARYQAAIIEFEAASSVIDTHVLSGSPPTTDELTKDKNARAKLVLARRLLIAPPLGHAS
jgi:hypothetical protein